MQIGRRPLINKKHFPETHVGTTTLPLKSLLGRQLSKTRRNGLDPLDKAMPRVKGSVGVISNIKNVTTLLLTWLQRGNEYDLLYYINKY